MRPKPGEVIQDPAAGTGGFLIAADSFMREATDDYFELSPSSRPFSSAQRCAALKMCRTHFACC